MRRRDLTRWHLSFVWWKPTPNGVFWLEWVERRWVATKRGGLSGPLGEWQYRSLAPPWFRRTWCRRPGLVVDLEVQEKTP
jgi:hypothetical protein